MTIVDTSGPFGATNAAGATAIPAEAGRTPLNVAAAQVAASLKHRFITPGILAGLARIIDFAVLAGLSIAIVAIYVDPRDAGPRLSSSPPFCFRRRPYS